MSSPFLDAVRANIRLRGYSIRTEKTYITWIKQFIYFINRQHPENVGADEVRAFLTSLATERNVAINTQKVALNALVFYTTSFYSEIWVIWVFRWRRSSGIYQQY